MTICVGEVVAIEGTMVTIRIFDESNKDTLYLDGRRFKGVSIREYLSIRRGFRDIVCIVQGEYLDERRFFEDQSNTYFIRKISVKPVGYLENERFTEGIKFLPMIKDAAYLIGEEVVASLYTRADQIDGLVIGKLLKEEIPIALPWQRLFNSHIGIFGNTGSGKSNTLTKLYTALFDVKANKFAGRSHFILLDFNGEYTNNQLIDVAEKRVWKLRTTDNGGDKLPLAAKEFWHADTQAILFQATANTQRPFLNRIINGWERFGQAPDSLAHYFQSTFERAFSSAAPRAEYLDLLRQICSIVDAAALEITLGRIVWHSSAVKFQYSGGAFFQANGVTYNDVLRAQVDAVKFNNINAFDEFIIRAHLQLARDLMAAFVQFEHIQPLLKRAEAAIVHLKKVVTIGGENPQEKILTVISLRNCNQEIKKILPLLIAKHYYNQHRAVVASPPDRTMHLIIDEAHNILSEQSAREHEVWRDYRLELFEEIIKEGRKFGMFLTLSSQRPADISPTIVSQLHNFFIHRLVNDRDLFLIENTISTLDQMSKSQIPNLSRGCCVVTGTAFDLPMTLQVDVLERSKQPDSEDVDLTLLWASAEKH